MATGEFGKKVARELALRAISFAPCTTRKKVPSVEDIQDSVEKVLLASPYGVTAKAYILYREQHAQIRNIIAQGNVDLVGQYLTRSDWQVNENSNMEFSLQGLNNYISSEISKNYWLYKIYPAEIRQAHSNGDLHIHDLNVLASYCVGWDLADLLMRGFGGVAGKTESKPPKHLRTALGQVVNFFYTLQGEAAGAQAFSNFDTLLAPFIRYDNLSYDQIKQALQEFIFNTNVPTRVGFQTPFTNVTLDLLVSPIFANSPVIIGGKFQDAQYKDFQHEMNLFNKAFFEVMLEGDAKGRVFTFPIPTYNITKDFDWDNPSLDLLWEITGKYGLPYFSNFINSDMKPEDARSMCCRLRLETKHLEKRGGGLFGSHPLTGSIGVVTLNLPRIGYTAKTEEKFLTHLKDLMLIAKNSLEIKRKTVERLTENGLYPYSKFYLKSIREKTGQYWSNHFSTIGLVGMNEACLNLLGVGIGTEKGRAFALRVMDYMRDVLVEFQKDTGHNYNLEATPAEGTSYRFAKKDKELYPAIIVANEATYKGSGMESPDHEGVPYYTNSTHLPVNFSHDPFEVLDLQDELQTKYTGGTVIHFFVGERMNDSQAVKNIVRKICQKYRLPYFTLTPTFSVCSQHGYLAGEKKTCPICNGTCEVYSRVVGYLRPVKQWNHGKKAEFTDRTNFKQWEL